MQGVPVKKLNYVVLLLLLAVGITAAQSGGTPPRQSINPQTGKVRFIGASVSNPIIVAGAVAPGLSNDARANAILSVYAPQFGVNAQDLSLVSEIIVDANRISRRYQQYYLGVPVVGGQIIVNMTPAGGLVSMLGDVSPDLAVSTVATVSGAQAQQIALQHVGKQFGVNTSTISASAPILGIYDERMLTVSSKSPALVWEMEVVSTVGAPIRAKVLVDAQTGWVALSFNRIHTHEELNPGKSLGQVNVEQARLQNQAGVGVRVPGTADLSTHTANNGTSLPGTFLCDETDLTCTDGADSDADSAHTHANGTYDIYWDWHGRDSLDAAGMQLISTVHVAVVWCNASWNGIQMQYGDGCASSIVVDDVVGHELTHGVTEFSSGLFYSYESGAINESFSDVWGEFYDLTNGTAEDTPANRWLVGEELGTIRNMKNPPALGDPDRTQSPLYYKGNADSGGVHSNSGVNNKAAYLMVDGETFNGFTVTGIGLDKTVAIYYDAQTTKLTPTSSYVQLGEALNQSCTELIGGPDGITAADCEQVMNATLATEMQIEPEYPPAAVADVCETGTPVTLFSDDFESGAANWTSTVDQGSDAWTINDTDGPLNGSFNLRGREAEVPTLSYAAMVNDVVLPSGSYLHFVHKFTFEPTYDGGIVQYSTNGGVSWSQVTSVPFYEEGINYVTNLDAGNPLGVIPAFTGLAGNGVGSTRYTLASLDGQSVRFRFALGTDLGTGGVGWRIDDVQIYTCDAGAVTETPTATETPEEPTPTPTVEPGTELIGNGGFENLGGDGKPDVTPWEVKNSSGDKAKCNKDKDGDGIPDKIVANGGECAFLFKNVVGEAGKIQQTLDLSSVIPTVGDGLDLSFFANSSGGATVKFKVVVKYADDTKTKISLESDGTEAYTEFAGSETLTSADITKAKVNAKSSATSGKVYVDDVSLLYVVNSGGARLIPMPQTNNLGTR
jgi:Zn-dependent metalloprotease